MTTSDLYDSDVLLDKAHQAMSKRQYSTAVTLFEQAAAKREIAIGDDMSVAQIKSDQGAVNVLLGRDGEAEKVLKEALAMGEKATYAGHGLLSPILQHLAELMIKQEKWADAEPYATRCMEINEKTLSADHRSTLQSIFRLGSVQKKQGKYPEAEKTFTKALKVIDSPLGPIEDFKYELAQCFQEQGKTAEAEKAYKEAIDGLEYRSNLPKLVECLNNYAEFLKKNDRSGEATPVLERAKVSKELSRDWRHNPDIFPSTLLRA